MELPKNITQIGESNPRCKIYVEDYAISYMKQLNYQAMDKQQAVGLYGRKTEESGITYIFLYGACRLHFLQRESRHLSQAVLLEVEKQRKKYFSEHTFLAYCILQGEMLEGFYICDQGSCRYVEGYAKFFEKNDSMLAFMLTDRQEEAQPEIVDREKYEEVRKRQEERKYLSGRGKYAERILVEDVEGRNVKDESIERKSSQGRRGMTENAGQKGAASGNFGKMRWAVAAAFVLLCVTGLLNMGRDEEIGDIQVAARQLMDALTEQKLPDEAQMVSASAQVGTIVAEDKLTDALKAENASTGEGQSISTSGEQVINVPISEPTLTSAPEVTPAVTVTPTAEPTPAVTATPTAAPTPQPTPEPTAAPVSYVVQEGDTLSAICWKVYGSDKWMGQVCEMNDIDNPDNIKVGEKILLPQ